MAGFDWRSRSVRANMDFTRATISLGSTGLVTYSSAPASKPRILAASSVCPLRIMMGKSVKLSTCRTRRTTSIPLVSGSITSMITRSGCSL